MEQALQRTIRQLYSVEVTPIVTRPDPAFGDYATNVAMQLAKTVSRPPREIAEALAAALQETGDYAKVDVAGPGFINITLAPAALLSQLANMRRPGYGSSLQYDGKIVLTEYSDPNPFKVLHAGHFYTSVVGFAISNLIEQAGGTVHRLNFGGDVGMHVAKTIWAIIQELGGEYPEKLTSVPEDGRSEWMAGLYVTGTNAYEDDEAAKQAITDLNKRIYQIHSDNDHDSPLAQLYRTCRTWSYDYFNTFYARIGTPFERYYPESKTAPIGLAAVLEQKDKGVYVESDGAVVFVGEPYGLHTRVFVNAQGLPTYESKDVGLSLQKWHDYHFDESIIITGNDITEYMKVVLKSIEQFEPELAHRTTHVTHGNLKLAGGVKMSSRKGNFLKAVDVLDITAAETAAVQPDVTDGAVLGAIKYAFLKSRVGPDIIFDPKESVALQGNSGPYLQYAHARARTILAKATVEPSAEGAGEPDQSERQLLVKLTEYPEVIQAATAGLSPHHICTYLYELAQTFNRFYETSRIIGDERQAFRLELTSAYATILKSGLTVLGIDAPDTM